MALMLFMLLSAPIGAFCAYFAWRAWKIGRTDVAWSMSCLSLFCLATAITIGAWAWLALQG